MKCTVSFLAFVLGLTLTVLVAGFALAAELCDREAEARLRACGDIKAALFRAIGGLDYQLNGDPRYCLPSTVNLSFRGVDAEGVFLALKEQYAFSNGSACNSGSHAPSYVLSAMGLPPGRISEAIRISWGHDTAVDFTALAEYVRSMV